MKKIILSILCFVLAICSVPMFVGCKQNDSGYDLSNLQTDFELVAKDCSCVKIESHKMDFDYSSINTYLGTEAKNVEPYDKMENFYEKLVDSSLQYYYEYVEICSDNSITQDSAKKNKVKQNIDTIKSNVTALEASITDLTTNAMDYAQASSLPMTSTECMVKYKVVLDNYQNLCLSCIEFSYSLYDIVPQNKIDYANQTLDKFDASRFVASIKTEIAINKLEQTKLYFLRYVKDCSLSTVYTQQEGGVFASNESHFSTYKTQVNALSVLYDQSGTISDKQKFLDWAIQLQNIEKVKANGQAKYDNAFNSVEYAKAMKNANDDKGKEHCATIDQYCHLVDCYTQTLTEIINEL